MISDQNLMQEFKKQTLVPPADRHSRLLKLVSGFSSPKLQEVSTTSEKVTQIILGS